MGVAAPRVCRPVWRALQLCAHEPPALGAQAGRGQREQAVLQPHRGGAAAAVGAGEPGGQPHRPGGAPAQWRQLWGWHMHFDVFMRLAHQLWLQWCWMRELWDERHGGAALLACACPVHALTLCGAHAHFPPQATMLGKIKRDVEELLKLAFENYYLLSR